MKRLHALVFFALLVSVSCRERATQSQANDDGTAARSRRLDSRQSTELRESAKLDKRFDDTDSLDSILATCERLKKGDGTGNINILELNSAYRQLANINPKLALDHFSDPKSFYAIGPALAGVLEIAVAQNPELVTQWLEQSLAGYEDIGQAAPFVSMTLDKLAAADPKKALAAFKRLEIPTSMKQSAIHALFRGVATKHPSEVIALSATIDPSFVPYALAGAANGAFERDPATAKTIAFSIPDDEVRKNTLNRMFAKWFESDSKTAGDELMKLDQKLVQNLLIEGVGSPQSAFYGLAKSSPAALLSLMDEIYPTRLNQDFFKAAIARTIIAEPEKSLDTISNLPEGKLKLDLYKEALSSLARENPKQTLEILTAEKDPALRMAVLPQVGEALGRRGMNETLRYLNQLDDLSDKSTAFSSAFNSICHSDLNSASAYLTSSERSLISLSPEDRNRGCQVVAYRLAASNLNDATEWMSRLPRADQPHAMAGIAHQMAEKDIAGLGDFLNRIEKNDAWVAGVKVLISTVESSDIHTARSWKQALENFGEK
jgi:hypothetical protein